MNSLSGLLSSLKLPQDGLSRSIVAFARFFSLPLEPKFLNTLRQTALHQAGTAREAAALGAAAAADKGLKLGDKALSDYAAAIEGSVKSFIKENPVPVHSARRESTDSQSADSHSESDTPDNSGGEGSLPGDQGAGTQKESGGRNGGTGGSFQGEYPQDKKPSNAQELQSRVTEILNDRPLLDLINRIPGKNSRWIVVPFLFYEEGFEFSVSLRILLHDKPSLSGVFERLTADILVSRPDSPGKRKRWLIVLEQPEAGWNSAAPLAKGRAEVSVFFEPKAGPSPAGKKLEKKLAKALGISPERVYSGDRPPLFADSREELLRTVDEEV